jgi:sugar diacid utilization regulator
MENLMEVLSGAFEIVGRSIAVILKHERCIFPEASSFDIDYNEAAEHMGRNYKGYNIYRLESAGAAAYVCIQSDTYFESEVTALVILSIKLSIDNENSLLNSFIKAVEGKHDAAELLKKEEVFKDYLPGYVVLVDNYKGFKNEVQEILINTLNTKFCFQYAGRIVAAVDEENIEEACKSFTENILGELLIECTVAIGGEAKSAKELKEKYEDAIKALYLKHTYALSENVIGFESMYGYRIAHNLSPKLKEYIRGRVFTPEFRGILSSELGITIEEFFKNNLNLTDTAAKLYIHRNTLLYRLDKIQKATGFDLKKFEDSWLFKLAWLIRKEIEQ